jgi:hypothetical protein
VIIDLRKDASMKDISSYVNRPDIGWFDGLIMKLTFRYMLIPRAYSVEAFAAIAERSKFGQSEITKDAIGMEIVLRK